MLCTVAFLPPADFIQSFEELAEEIRNIYNGEVDELLNYLKIILSAVSEKCTLSSSIVYTGFMEHVPQNRRVQQNKRLTP